MSEGNAQVQFILVMDYLFIFLAPVSWYCAWKLLWRSASGLPLMSSVPPVLFQPSHFTFLQKSYVSKDNSVFVVVVVFLVLVSSCLCLSLLLVLLNLFTCLIMLGFGNLVELLTIKSY